MPAADGIDAPAAQSLTVETHDGLTLAAWRYPAPGPKPRARVVLVHGYAEHTGRYAWLVGSLVAAGYECDVFDLRGHGRSTGARGHVARFADYLDDLERIIARPDAAQPLFGVGHSLGGLIALEYARVRPGTLAGLAVSSPFLAPAFEVTPLLEKLAAVVSRVAPRQAVKSNIDPGSLTHDVSVAEAYSNDPLVFDTATLGWWREVRRVQEDLLASAPDIRLPVLFLLGDADRVANWRRAADVFERLGSADKSLKVYAGFFHEVLNEVGRARVLQDLVEWLEGHSIRPSG